MCDAEFGFNTKDTASQYITKGSNKSFTKVGCAVFKKVEE